GSGGGGLGRSVTGGVVSTVRNCIFYGNTSTADAQVTAGTDVQYSLVQGGWLGTGNIDGDPLFVDADGADNTIGTADDNLTVAAGSPAINRGNNAVVAPDENDLDGDANTAEPTPFDRAGQPRFADACFDDPGDGSLPRVDLGAYESTLSPQT